MSYQLVGGLPGVRLVLAADHLQPHAEADVVFAAMRARHRRDLGDVRGDLFRQVAPEQMHVGMPGGQFPGLARAAAEIEFWKRLLVRTRPDMRAGQLVKSSLEGDRSARGPQRFQD